MDDDQLDAMCLWIRANIHKQIGWYELSKVSNLSHTHLIRLFRKINTTPMSFIRKIRDEEQKRDSEFQILRQRKNTIHQIEIHLAEKIE